MIELFYNGQDGQKHAEGMLKTAGQSQPMYIMLAVVQFRMFSFPVYCQKNINIKIVELSFCLLFCMNEKLCHMRGRTLTEGVLRTLIVSRNTG